MIIDLQFANDFFNSLPSKYKDKWNALSEEEKEGMLFKAELEVQTLRFKDRYIWENPPLQVKQAICLQAFYISENHEDIAHIINEKNGINSMTLQSFSVNQGLTSPIYKEPLLLLNRYILRGGRFR